MTLPSLRALLESAEHAIETLRHPDVREAQGRLNEILEAAGLGGTGSDRITRLRVDGMTVSLETAYSVRGCLCDDSFEFPAAILDAPDPVRAATRWGLETKRAKAVREIEQARRSLSHWEADLAGIEARLAAA